VDGVKEELNAEHKSVKKKLSDNERKAIEALLFSKWKILRSRSSF
jgi:hypothetical protein